MTVIDSRTRHRAHVEVREAIESGELELQPCEVCGSLKVVAHHDDYSEPLEVVWLCRRHHLERHRQLGWGVPSYDTAYRGFGRMGYKRKTKKPRLLTPRQVGEQLSFSPRTITRWCREGRFKEARKVGRVWRIPEG